MAWLDVETTGVSMGGTAMWNDSVGELWNGQTSTTSTFVTSSPLSSLLHLALTSTSTSSSSSSTEFPNYSTDYMEDDMNFTLACDEDPRLSTNFSQFDYHYRTTTWIPITWREVIKLIAYMITTLVSLVGNTLVILVVRYNRNMRSSTNQYLVNLAVADLLVTLLCKWVHLVRHLSYPHYVLPAFMCYLDGFVQATSLVASVFTLTVISIGRFVAIMYPLHARTSPDRAIRVIAAVWVASALLSCPMLFFREFYKTEWANFTTYNCDEFFPTVRELRQGVCVVTFDAKQLFYIIFTVTCYFLPVTIMIVNYSLIVWKLWGAQRPGEQHQQQRVTRRNTQRVVRMVTVVLLVFVVCWTPLQTLILYTSITDHPEVPEWLQWMEFAAYFVAHSNSALNPIIYCGFNANFRQGLVTLLYCKHSRSGRFHHTRSWRGLTGRDTLSGYSGPEPAVLVEMGSVRHSRLTQRASASSVNGRLVYSGSSRELRHNNHHHHHNNKQQQQQLGDAMSNNTTRSINTISSNGGGGGGEDLQIQELPLTQHPFVRASYRRPNGSLTTHTPSTSPLGNGGAGGGGGRGGGGGGGGGGRGSGISGKEGEKEDVCGCYCCGGRRSGWRGSTSGVGGGERQNGRKSGRPRWGGGLGGWGRKGRWVVEGSSEGSRWGGRGGKGELSGSGGLGRGKAAYKEVYTLNTGIPDTIFVRRYEAVV